MKIYPDWKSNLGPCDPNSGATIAKTPHLPYPKIRLYWRAHFGVKSKLGYVLCGDLYWTRLKLGSFTFSCSNGVIIPPLLSSLSLPLSLYDNLDTITKSLRSLTPRLILFMLEARYLYEQMLHQTAKYLLGVKSLLCQMLGSRHFVSVVIEVCNWNKCHSRISLSEENNSSDIGLNISYGVGKTSEQLNCGTTRHFTTLLAVIQKFDSPRVHKQIINTDTGN